MIDDMKGPAYIRVIPRRTTHDEALAALLHRYGAAVYGVLRAIRAHEMTEYNRYLILKVEESGYYVQCMFYNDDQSLHCEAVSGAYEDWSLTEQQTAVLASLGYDVTKPGANCAVEHSVSEDDSLRYMPILLIETLYRAYGLTQESSLRFEAPFVPGFHDLEALVYGAESQARR